MRRIAVSWVAVLALLVPAAAGEAEDAAYEALVAAAMSKPGSVDFVRMRSLYAASKYYKGAASNPDLMGKFIVAAASGKPTPQALKDEAMARLKSDFALPGIHPAVMAIMGYTQYSPQVPMHQAAYQGLADAIIETGEGDSEQAALKVLVRGEPDIVLERLELESLNRERVEEGGRVYYVYKTRDKSGSWFSWGSKTQLWFDITAFEEP